MSPGPDRRSLGSRLDRLPWSGRHMVILLALGAGWLFDSFEVQLFSSAVGPLGDHFGASVTARDAVLAVWLVGILLGALLGGPLTDRFGRRRLFVATLIWYAGFTVLTGLAPTLGVVYLLRFAAALGVGAEYAIVTTAIAEFMPARVRGRANAAVMNFWPAGAILAALLAYLLLDVAALGAAVSWRYMFFYLVGNVGALAGGLAMSLVIDRVGRRATVIASYSAAAAGVGLLAAATATGSSGWVTGAFVVASAAATAAWTSAYPTFTELFPTHLRGAGVGASVAAGRVGAIVGTLLLPSVATSLGASASYGLVAAFWLVGVAAMAGFSARGGPEAACLPLESLAPPVLAAAA